MSITKISPSVVDFDAGITITVDDNSDTLTLTSTDADASVGPVLNLYRNSSSPADNDLVGSIKAVARNDNSQDVETFKISNYITDVSDGTEDAASFFYLMEGGSLRERIGLASSATVINEDGLDVDFRVESDGKTHALFVDGGNNQVLFNTSSARSTSGVTASTQIHGTGYNDASLALIGDMGASALTAPILFFAKTRGSAGANTAVTDGDRLGAIFFNGADGSDIETVAASIDCVVDGTSGSDDLPGRLTFRTSSDGSGSNTERFVINSSGQLIVAPTGTFSPLASGLMSFRPTSAYNTLTFLNPSTSAHNHLLFYKSDGSTLLGYIQVSNTATTFSTSSDYRLKENVKELDSGIDKVKLLKPVTFDWKEEDTSSIGFIAHEVQEVFADAVVGEKDGEMMQGVDYGRITPILTAALQEAIAKIETLEAKVKALEEA